MKPVKSLKLVSSWLLRLGLLSIVLQSYIDPIIYFNYTDPQFYVSIVVILITIFIFIGAILNKSAYTIFSGGALIIISLLIMSIDGFAMGIVFRKMILIALGSYFLTNGNN